MAQSVHVSVRSFSDSAGGTPEIPLSAVDGFSVVEGICYLKSGDRVYSCEDSPEGRELLEKLRVAEGLRKDFLSEEEALRNVLEGKADPFALRRYGLTEYVRRCVILFHPSLRQDMRQMRDLIPAEDADRMAVTENGDLALIMRTDYRTFQEVFEFASAAVGMMESEAGIDCCAGIGRPADGAAGLSGSYRDAESAIDTGIRHRIPGKVFAYEKQTLERIVDAIPPDRAEAIRREILQPGSERVLTEDIFETIQVFFQNDLNLSTTARQLFIHRNTLLYRMEKIRKETGLDLRKFEDAVVFRMLINPAGKREDHR